jgi:DNA-directed RNA polymerase specialized sigma24 family protein
VEHRSRAAVDRAIEEARARYLAGVTSLRLMRVVDPEGGLRIIDFEHEKVRQHPVLVGVIDAAEHRARARAAAEGADAEWRRQIREAALAGMPYPDIARAAGTTPEHVRRILGRGRGPLAR